MPGCAGVDDPAARVADVLQFLIDRFGVLALRLGNTVLQVDDIVRDHDVGMFTGQRSGNTNAEELRSSPGRAVVVGDHFAGRGPYHFQRDVGQRLADLPEDRLVQDPIDALDDLDDIGVGFPEEDDVLLPETDHHKRQGNFEAGRLVGSAVGL